MQTYGHNMANIMASIKYYTHNVVLAFREAASGSLQVLMLRGSCIFLLLIVSGDFLKFFLFPNTKIHM